MATTTTATANPPTAVKLIPTTRTTSTMTKAMMPAVRTPGDKKDTMMNRRLTQVAR